MKRSTLAAVAIATVAACAGASAATAQITVTEQPYYGYGERYGPPLYAYQSQEYDHHWRHRCEAPRWDPNARYMPGQAVWRKGQVWVATETSRHVYNVNSPPEWTPNYWQPARC
jgi:hypothetical protein